MACKGLPLITDKVGRCAEKSEMPISQSLGAPSPEGCETGVTDSSPVGVVGELTCPEGLLLCVAITHDHVWDGILS